MSSTIRKQSFIGAAIGTTIEYYDYALFAIFLPLIAPQFFPAEDAYHSLMKGYYVLTIAMLARPFGSVFFGHIGDMIGRRRALLLSMYGIAVTTFIIGLTPTYQSIGVWSVVIIVISKCFQLACFGGEYNGAGIYVVEHANKGNEGFWGGLLTAIVCSGGLIASLLGVLLTLDDMPEWSWRIAFIIGGLIGVFGILYRKKMHESPQFTPADPAQTLGKMINKFPRQILAGIFIGGFATIPFTTVITFINPVLMTKGFMTKHELMWLQSAMIFLGSFVLVLSGTMADRTSPRRIMRAGALMLTALSLPALWLVDLQSFFWLIIASTVFIVINEVTLGPANAYLKNIFPAEYRYRGSSLSFTIGMSLLGGLTPLVENALYHATGQFTSAALWLVFIGVGAYWSIGAAQSDYSPAMQTEGV